MQNSYAGTENRTAILPSNVTLYQKSKYFLFSSLACLTECQHMVTERGAEL